MSEPSSPTKSSTFEELVDAFQIAVGNLEYNPVDDDYVAAYNTARSALVSAHNELEASLGWAKSVNNALNESNISVITERNSLRSRIAGLEEQYYELQQMAAEEVSALSRHGHP